MSSSQFTQPILCTHLFYKEKTGTHKAYRRKTALTICLDKTEVPFNTKSKSQLARTLCFSSFSCPFSVSIHFLEAYYTSDIVLATVLENMCSLSHVRLFATPQTVAHQAPLSMGFSRQEDWSGLPFLSRGSFRPRLEPWSPASPALTDGFFYMSHLGSLP